MDVVARTGTELSRNPTVIEIADFARADDCAVVIDAYERCRARYSHKTGDGFFDHRVLWINSFPDAENATRKILQAWRFALVDIISRHSGCRLYSDTIQVVSWNGQAMPPHQDDRYPDGRPHSTPWREWASIVYLNGDFDGGEIYFPEAGDLSYKPVRGSAIFFRGGAWHGVRAVTDGLRYTAPGWYTRSLMHEDRYARVDY